MNIARRIAASCTLVVLALILSSCHDVLALFLNDAPTVHIVEMSDSYTVGTTCRFEADAQDPDGDALSIQWRVDGTEADCVAPKFEYVFTETGSYEVSVRVDDGEYLAEDSVLVSVVEPAAGDDGNLSEPTSYNYRQSKRLLGDWTFVFTIISTFYRDYFLARMEESTISPGEWNCFGTDEWGDLVIAGYNPDTDDFSLYSDGYSFELYYVFDFVDQEHVQGSYYQIDKETGEWSRAYAMNGYRLASRGLISAQFSTLSDFDEEAARREATQSVVPAPELRRRFESMREAAGR